MPNGILGRSRSTVAAIAILLGSLSTVLSSPTSLTAAERVAGDRRLPPETYAYATIPNVEALKERWSASLLGELFRDPELAEVREELSRQLDEASREAEKETGVKLRDLLMVPSGEVSLAITRAGASRPLTYVLFLDFGESRETVDKLLEKLEETMRDGEGKRTVDEFEDTRIVEYEIPNSEGAPEGFGRKLAYFIKDTQIVVSGQREALETILVRWDGRHGSTFAENAVHRYIDERCAGEDVPPVLTWYLDPVGIAEAIIAGQPASLQSAMILGALPQLGLRDLKAIGGSYTIAPRDYDSVTKTLVYVDEPADGVLKIFRLTPTRLAPPAWVPADVANYVSLNWNVPGAYDAVESVVDGFQGPGAFRKLVDQVAEHDGGPMLHPRKDLVDQLTGVIHLINMPATDEAGEDSASLFAFGVKDAGRMRTILGALAKTDGFPGKAREFRGETIYELGDDAGTGVEVAVGIAVGNLVFTTDVKLLENMLRGEQAQNPLVEHPEYRRASAKFPAETSLIGFQRTDLEFQTVYDALRKLPRPTESGEFDTAKLPKFELLRKYLTAQGVYAIPDRHGAILIAYSLRRESR